MLLMLEDDAARVQRFKAALTTIDPDLRLLVWRDARAMIREVGPLPPESEQEGLPSLLAAANRCRNAKRGPRPLGRPGRRRPCVVAPG